MSQNSVQSRSPAGYPWEDRALKEAARLMGEELLPLLGIEGKIRRVAPTEQVYLQTEDFSEDFNYEMEDGSLLHLEFESDAITKEDLRRFLVYEALLSYQHHVEVRTCVVCTARTRTLGELKTGLNTYRVQVVNLRNWNVDRTICELEEAQKVRALNREELLRALLVPLMGGELTQMERIRWSFQLLRQERERRKEADLPQMEAVLYALAEKFLEKTELNELKEAIHMTRLGQMIYDDGVQDGMEKGEDRVNSLNSRLLEQNRADDVLRAARDSEYQKKLFAEFNL